MEMDANSFTGQLNYPVCEISRQEFLLAIEIYTKEENKREEELKSKLYQVDKA